MHYARNFASDRERIEAFWFDNDFAQGDVRLLVCLAIQPESDRQG
ncbi:hypothetical protein [Variovorax paradoxus]|nr:hypothetical protein [Variovorax paradoxus]MDQ0586603.1 hypothetical protein [Variovorax paradoxus]